MVKNSVEQLITPEMPNVLPSQQIQVHMPVASTNNKGAASFDDEYFTVVRGLVNLKMTYIVSLLKEEFQTRYDGKLNTSSKYTTDAINEIYSKVNKTFDGLTDLASLVEEVKSIAVETSRAYFESDFYNVYLTLKYSAENVTGKDRIKKGDIFIITNEDEPDFVVLDDTGMWYDDVISIIQDRPPVPEEGKKYRIADTYTIVGIQSGVKMPAVDTSLDKDSLNAIANKVVTSMFETINDNINHLDGKISEAISYVLQTSNAYTDTEILKMQSAMSGVDTFLADKIAQVADKTTQAIEIAKGATRSFSFSTYAEMIASLKAANKEEYGVGDHVLIRMLNVPDLWIYSIMSTSSEYTYTTDEQFVADLYDYRAIVGYYVLSPLETQKVSLEDYAKKSEVPSITVLPSEMNGAYTLVITTEV